MTPDYGRSGSNHCACTMLEAMHRAVDKQLCILRRLAKNIFDDLSTQEVLHIIVT